MNLLLLLSLLQIWSAVAGMEPPVIGRLRTICDDASQMLDEPAKLTDDQKFSKWLDGTFILNSDQIPEQLKDLRFCFPDRTAYLSRDQQIAAAPLSELTRLTTSPGVFLKEHPYVHPELIGDLIGNVVNIQAMIAQSGLPEEASIGQLARSVAQAVKVPFVDQEVSFQIAFWILGVANFVILLYLLSLLLSLREIAKSEAIPEILDVIMLHPSRLSLVLGIGWLILPVAVAEAFAWVNVWKFAIVFVVPSGFVVLIISLLASEIRKKCRYARL